ncbi:MAG: SpoIID/LytB domain-containing protein [Candidatus Kerfeldbacteria bacterium]
MALLTGVFLVAFFIGDPSYANATQLPEPIYIQRPNNPVMSVLIGEAKAKNKFSVNTQYVIEDTEGRQFIILKAHQHMSISYENGMYIAKRGNNIMKSNKPLRVTPDSLKKKVTITNYENRPAWNTELNDNVFFGSIEVVYSENTGRLLLVNHIPLERYVRGIAEVSNSHPKAYLKSLLVAARTYALYNILHPTKHADEPYILDATDNDQIYRGANFSKRSPRVRKAQKKTRKKVIMYDGEPIIAPYFSCSDGRTRAWSEVWNGSYAWAQAVDDPCCTTMTLWGHGVGLSGEGARYFAGEGWGYKKILKYYYSGVEIKKGY